MKNFQQLFMYTLGISLIVYGCKKSGSSPDNKNPAGLSYQFNGQTYTGGAGDWGIDFNGSNITGINIRRDDLFGGEVIFYPPNCAYVNTGTRLVELHENCILTYDDGSPIDSSVVYLYQSGNFNSTASNCRYETKHDPFTGEDYSVEICDIEGNFSLTLINNKGDKIEITNGTIGGRFEFQ